MLTTVKGGLPGMPAFIGFGSWGQGLAPFTSPINAESLLGNITGNYFVVPFTIEINSLIAFYNPLLQSPDSPDITISAQLYEADETSNIFFPIEETLVTLSPSITKTTPYGSLLKGEARNNRVVEKNKKLLLVFTASSNGPDKVDMITGCASAYLIYT